MAGHNRFGELGETLATRHLEKLGFQIVQTNWRMHRYEIDIIARNGDTIHFVEVKTRKVKRLIVANDDFSARSCVTARKLEHLCEGVQFYVDTNGVTQNVSLDLVAIDFFDDSTIEIDYFPNIND